MSAYVGAHHPSKIFLSFTINVVKLFAHIKIFRPSHHEVFDQCQPIQNTVYIKGVQKSLYMGMAMFDECLYFVAHNLQHHITKCFLLMIRFVGLVLMIIKVYANLLHVLSTLSKAVLVGDLYQ